MPRPKFEHASARRRLHRLPKRFGRGTRSRARVRLHFEWLEERTLLAPVFLQEAELAANTTEVSGFGFGSSVAISGDIVVVGAPNIGTNGVAYIYVKPDGGWADMRYQYGET